MSVEFDLKNTGAVDGAEVAQVYAGPGPEAKGVQQAVRALRGFERVELKAGETRHVTIKLEPRLFQYWGERVQKGGTNAGERTIFVGDADALDHLPLSAKVEIKAAE